MKWYNSVLITPTVGIHFKPNYRLAFESNKLFAELITKLDNDDNINELTFSPNGGFYLLENDGYEYNLNKNNLTVSFKYILKQNEIAGQLPTTKDCDIQKFDELIEICKEKLFKVFSLIIKSDCNPSIKRFGFVANCIFDPDLLPPGVEFFLNCYLKPWKKGIDKIKSMVSAKLNFDEEFYDRCHHHLDIDYEKENIQLAVVLDWQRVFNNSKSYLTNNDFKKKFNNVYNESMAYFEIFGERGIENV